MADVPGLLGLSGDLAFAGTNVDAVVRAVDRMPPAAPETIGEESTVEAVAGVPSAWSDELGDLIIGPPLLLAACGVDPEPAGDQELSEVLQEACEGSREVQLAELTGFEWDTVYVFAPYAWYPCQDLRPQ